MPTLIYLRGAQGNSDLLKDHEKPIRQLLTGDYVSSNLEKLQGHEVYSYRLSIRERLLFAIHHLGGHPYMVVLEYLPTHDYHKSRFLRSGVLQRYLEKQEAGKARADFAELSFKEHEKPLPVMSKEKDEAIKLETIDYYQQRLITLNLEQQQVIKVQLPALISGVAGSGKSCVALSLLTDYVAQCAQQKDSLPAVYVSKSKPLVKRMGSSWQDLPLALDAEGGGVSFMTYDAFLQTEDASVKDYVLVADGEASFCAWYLMHVEAERKKAKALGYEIPVIEGSIAYQECRIASAFTKENYIKLGARQRLISEQAHREWLYAAYVAYQAHLKHAGQLNPEFYEFTSKTRYGLIVVDEAPDLSLLQLMQLHACAQGAVVFCMDSHQRLNDRLSVRPFLLEHLRIPEQQHVELQISYRCPLRVLAVANQMIAIKHQLVGGLADKHEPVSIKHSAPESPMGHVYLMNPDKVLDDAWVKTQAALPHCAIITSEEHLQEAQKYFNKSVLIFTPKTIKGLEYDMVIAWKLYDKDFMAQVRKQLRSKEHQGSVHRPKDGTGQDQFGPPLNQIYTSYTRSKEVLIIAEPPNRNNEPILSLLRSLQDKEPPNETWLQTQTHSGDWEQALITQLEEGNEAVAKAIFTVKLDKDEEKFPGFVAEWRQKKEATKPARLETKRPQSEWRAVPRGSAGDFKSGMPTPIERVERKIPAEKPKTAKPAKISPVSIFSGVSSKERMLISKAIAGLEVSPKTVGVKPLDLSKAHSSVLSLKKSFDARRLKIILEAYSDVIWLHPYFDETEQKSIILADLLLQEGAWRAFTSVMLNNTALLLKTPLNTLQNYLPWDGEGSEKRAKDLELLIRYRRRLQEKPNYIAATCAVIDQRYSDLQLLHDLGADLNQLDGEGWNAMHLLVQDEQLDTLRLFKTLAVDLNKPNAKGIYPAHLAVFAGKPESLKVLKELGVSLSPLAREGFTPCFLAAELGSIELVRLFTEWNIDLETPCYTSKSHLTMCSQWNPKSQQRMRNFLKAFKEEDKIALLPRQIAELMGYAEVVKLLPAEKPRFFSQQSASSDTSPKLEGAGAGLSS